MYLNPFELKVFIIYEYFDDKRDLNGIEILKNRIYRMNYAICHISFIVDDKGWYREQKNFFKWTCMIFIEIEELINYDVWLIIYFIIMTNSMITNIY